MSSKIIFDGTKIGCPVVSEKQAHLITWACMCIAKTVSK